MSADNPNGGGVHDAWAEAMAIVQSEQDADVHDEARGLMVAEMSSVTVCDRLMAKKSGSSVRLATSSGLVISGRIDVSGEDFVVIEDANARHLVAMQAISAIGPLPHVVHNDDSGITRTTWRSILRECFGQDVSVQAQGISESIRGRLSWVGHDHLGVDKAGTELVIRWPAVTAIRLPAGAD